MIDGVHGRRSPGYGSIREPERAYSAGRKTWDEDQESIEAVRRGEVNRRQVVAASSVYSRDTDGRSYFQDGRYVYK